MGTYKYSMVLHGVCVEVDRSQAQALIRQRASRARNFRRCLLGPTVRCHMWLLQGAGSLFVERYASAGGEV